MTARVGTAGWSIPARWKPAFPEDGSQLERYAQRLPITEINSSFYRRHKRETYARWRDATPPHFRFSIKAPRTITHERRLRDGQGDLEEFLQDISTLGDKLGVILVQLPPSLAFDGSAEAFFQTLRARWSAPVACEPRHASWFTPEANDALRRLEIARVAADPPAGAPAAAEPGGWPGFVYRRLHGAPRVYYSPYTPEFLSKVAATLSREAAAGIESWCVLDNTAEGAAPGDALALLSRLSG